MAYTFRSDETLVNTQTAGTQEQPAAAPVGADRVLVVYLGRSADGATAAIRGQMYDNSGNKVGSELIFYSGDGVFSPTVTARPDGGYTVGWLNSGGVVIRDYDAQGAFISENGFTVPGTDLTSETLVNGSRVFLWDEAAHNHVEGRIITATGNLQTFTVAGRSAAVAALPDGRFVVATAYQGGIAGDPAGFAIVAEIRNADGTVSVSRFLVNTVVEGNQTVPSVAALDSGGFVVTWIDSAADGSGTAVRAQIFSSAGARVGGEIAVNTTTAGNQTDAFVAGTDDGGFVVGWTDASGIGDASGTGIKSQLFDSAGNKIGGETLVNTATQNDQYQPFLAETSDEDVFVLWTDQSGLGGDASPPSVKLRVLSEAIIGTDSAETISGTPGDDEVRAGGGNDTILVQQGGNDRVEGGDGNDIIYFGATYTPQDSVDGGSGRDILALQGVYFYLDLLPASLSNVEVIAVMSSTDNSYGGGSGSPYRYTIETADANVAAGSALTIEGRALQANESLTFYGYNETDGSFALFGGAGGDYLEGGARNDYIDGGLGVDTMVGGLGDDIFFVDTAGDIVRDNDGYDAVYTSVSYTLHPDYAIELLATTNSSSTTAVALTGNNFAQTVVGTAGADTLSGLGGNDFLVGNGGADFLYGGTGNDVMDGGAGDDSYFADNVADVIIENAGNGNDTVYADSVFVLLGSVSVETLVYTGTGGVALYGNEFGQTIRTGQGQNDNDSIAAGAGNDYLVTYGGNDFLDGGAGADVMEGGTGSDIYLVDDSGDIVLEGSSDGGYDQVYTTTSYALGLDSAVERLAVVDSSSTAPLDLYGSNFDQTISGNDGANVIGGGGGNDYLIGGGGNDILDGGLGTDIVEGGAGADIFRFTSTADAPLAAPDQIRDFLSGTDRIDLSGIDANANAEGDQAFTYIGSGAFTGQAGQLRSEVANGQVYVTGDTNGDGAADFAIVLNNTTIVAASDFIL